MERNGCACILRGYDDCCSVELQNKMVKARKNHKCCECGRKIEKGEIYEYYVAVWDGDLGTFKTCKGCKIIRDELFCGGWTYGEIWAEIWENIAEIATECFSALILKLPDYTKEQLTTLVLEHKEGL